MKFKTNDYIEGGNYLVKINELILTVQSARDNLDR